MEQKFEPIDHFAELWDFIDAPLRTYYSGMFARLGFAIATDVEPDVLFVDEALAVGDEAFQRKSTGRMEASRDQSATVLVVSHNLAVVNSLCDRATWLDHGILRSLGDAEDNVDRYTERAGT